MNDWPLYFRTKLKNDPALLAYLPAGEDSIYGAGSLDGPPQKKPFLIIHTDAEERGAFPGRGKSFMSVHVHDQPGTYSRIRLVLALCRNALCGADQTEGQASGAAGVTGGGTVRWTGNSADLADEGFNTIVRTGSYECTGADGDD